jgi:hypothetical protein
MKNRTHERRRSAGLCVRCEKQLSPEEARIRCEDCREHVRKRVLEKRETNPNYGRHRACRDKETQRRRQRKHKYGEGAHEHLLHKVVEQGHRCAICRRTFEDSPCLDHDHKTSQWRGALCKTCNRGLGQFGDNIEMLQNAAVYLKYWLEQQS